MVSAYFHGASTRREFPSYTLLGTRTRISEGLRGQLSTAVYRPVARQNRVRTETN